MTAATLSRPTAPTSSSKSTKTKSTAPRLPRPKPVYKPTVKLVPGQRGCYDVSSETYAGHIYYRVDLRGAGQCECPAGQHGRACKHIAAARYWDSCIRPAVVVQPTPAPAKSGAALLLEAFGE